MNNFCYTGFTGYGAGMYDLDDKLNTFKTNVENIKNKEFSDFSDLENSYCELINFGTEIRNYIKNNPDVCDENSLKVLTNQTTDFSLLDEKFKPLFSIITLTQELLKHYQDYVFKLINQKDYTYAIKIYEQMFKFSHNYNYKLEIANIYFKLLDKPFDCYHIYKQIEPYMSENPRFLWCMSEIYSFFGNYFRQFVYIRKAIDIELANINKERNQ